MNKTIQRVTRGVIFWVLLHNVLVEAGIFTEITVGVLWLWQEFTDYKLSRLTALNTMILSAHEPKSKEPE